MSIVRIRPRRFFDPDTRLLSLDKLQHALGGALVATILLALGWGPIWSAVLTLAFGATYELGQWDSGRHFAYNLDTDSFRPGFGFGLIDLLADMLGAAAPIALYCYLGFTPLPSHPRIHDPHGILPREYLTTSSGVDTSQTSALSRLSLESAAPAVPRRSSP